MIPPRELVVPVLARPLGPEAPFPSGTGHALVDVGGAPIQPPSTRVAVVADPGRLHVLFTCDADPPLRVAVREPDGPVFEDECVEVFWCLPADPARYLEVVVNPAGIVYAARVWNPDGSRETWQVTRGVEVPGLAVAAGGAPPGALPDAFTSWTCRISIPWSTLGEENGCPEPGGIRRANFYRIARGQRTRFEAFSPTGRVDPPDFHVPVRYGTVFLDEVL